MSTAGGVKKDSELGILSDLGYAGTLKSNPDTTTLHTLQREANPAA